jgi:ABC-type antimicrobial peptide transport system permease subunit
MSQVGYPLDEPGGADFYTVLLLREGSNPIETNRKINSVLSDYFEQIDNTECPYTFSLNPITKWHLYSFTGTGNRYQYVYVFTAVALFILLIACMNFVNLSTARSVTRAKEIGLRKVIGANRLQLVRHLLGEYLLIAIISAIIAVGIAELLLPVFNHYAGETLVISYTNTTLIAGLIGIVTITGILAGIFPALYLSAFQPVAIMRGLLKSGKGGIQFRRILVVLQFTLSLILIVGTIVISTQINYMKDKDIGVNKANVLYVVPTSGIMRHISSFRQSLLDNPNVTSVSIAAQWLPHINSTIGQNFDYEGKDPNLKLELHFDWVSLDYTKTLGLEMADGRFYSQEFPTDLSEGIVLNQTAVNRMGIENPIGKRFSYWGKNYRIIGVIKDFHLEPLYETLKPMILIYADFERWSFGHLYIKINPDNIAETIGFIETVYKDIEPTGQFSYTFLDESYDRLYRSEYRFGDMAKYATGLAIFIACLGLFGMASFTTERRTKEIGIRKVLGATVSGIIGLLTKEFIVLVIIAGIVAPPVAFFVMNKWLNHFAYHAKIGIWMFVLACVITLVITLLTVCSQAIKAAIANPVDALRYE